MRRATIMLTPLLDTTLPVPLARKTGTLTRWHPWWRHDHITCSCCLCLVTTSSAAPQRDTVGIDWEANTAS